MSKLFELVLAVTGGVSVNSELQRPKSLRDLVFLPLRHDSVVIVFSTVLSIYFLKTMKGACSLF